MESTEPESPWMTKAEAAVYLRVSEATVGRWAREGHLTTHKVAGTQSVRYPRAEVEALITPAPGEDA